MRLVKIAALTLNDSALLLLLKNKKKCKKVLEKRQRSNVIETIFQL